MLLFNLSLSYIFLSQLLLKIDSDEHIFKFVMAKLGYGEALKRYKIDFLL